MKPIELAKVYDPKSFEDRLYRMWKDNFLFQPQMTSKKKPFTIVMPPPNVTGVLHMGHGLQYSLQDILVRFHRMLGEPSLWVPGTDHAGIATQHVVEKKLLASGVRRQDLGRAKFEEETWKVAREHKAIITKQLEKIGSSCDWSRERFTLDPSVSKAVREVFIALYKKDLIYKGKYLVNWCPSCGTALADDEVEHEEKQGHLYHIYYEIADGPTAEFPDGKIQVATTRPETLFGDVAVAANPSDERYKNLIGKNLKLPITGRLIPLITDDYADKEFGTGLVKITPAHDFNDFEVGNRHNLTRINVLTPDGRLNENVPESYTGLTTKEARKKVLQDLKASGLFIREDNIKHSVGACYRCATVVEPYLSDQWFIRMKPLAEKALKAWKDGEIEFFPKRWENTYEHWLTNIRDWCISRQLWWGHRTPTWLCTRCGLIMVEEEEPLRCPKCGSTTDIVAEEYVLDTWFSSALWPFSTLGWPKDTADLRRFYPNTVLVTGYDIIFFWVSRMIMMGLEFMDKPPFAHVCLTTIIRDKQGRKMSKSLGNGIDPLEVVEEYGADALKFTLAFMFTSTQDVLIDKEDFKLGSRFANKIWNASRYLLMNLQGEVIQNAKANELDLWILHKLNLAAQTVRETLLQYRFNDAAEAVYEYFWNDFCDWYIEATKLSLKDADLAEKSRATTMLLTVLEESLRLLHPFVPFISEEIYQMLPNKKGYLIVQAYPEFLESRNNPALAAEVESLQELVRLARTLRSEFQIAPDEAIPLHIKFDNNCVGEKLIRGKGEFIASLVNGPVPEFVTSKTNNAISLVGRGFEAYALVKNLVDVAKLTEKFQKDITKDTEYCKRTEAKLNNEQFVKSAPAAIVQEERDKLAQAMNRREKLEQYIKDLQ